ncbi:hypothetical protein ACMFMG_011399 [Clarireedia jacksonii]
MGLLPYSIGNLRLIAQAQTNPQTLQKYIEMAVGYEKELFEKSSDKVYIPQVPKSNFSANIVRLITSARLLESWPSCWNIAIGYQLLSSSSLPPKLKRKLKRKLNNN